MHWASAYIGLPWEARAEGPEAFYCWSFVRFVLREHYGLDVPFIANPQGLRGIARAFREHPELQRWKTVSHPQDGDAVLMRQSRHPIHVGLWLKIDGGGVLHCSRDSGVVFQDLLALRQHGWRVDEFYRLEEKR